jgi:hypothetical protein
LTESHAHDETHVGDEPVVRAQHGGAQRIPAHGPVTALKPGDGAALEPLRWGSDHFEDAGVAALVRGQAAFHCFRLMVVGAAVRLFERVDGRQHEGGPEAAGEPAECAGPEARLEARDTGVAATKLTPPIFGMCVFDGSEPAIDLGDLLVRLYVCERAIERRPVDLALQVLAIAFRRVVGHDKGLVDRLRKEVHGYDCT